MKNIFCVDLEEWYNSNLLACGDIEIEDRVEQNAHALLHLFKEKKVKATFFCLGSVAEKHPQLITDIHTEGHEIACHGYGHKLVYQQTPQEFEEDICRAKKILEDITGMTVLSYRAPSWSIREDSFWALEILQKNGFKYDSSIFPFKNFLYGVNNAPRFVYSTKKYNARTDLIEQPPATIRILGSNVPFSGGFYFRILPFWFIHICIKVLNHKGHKVVMYIHPWEVDPHTPHMKLSFRDSIIQHFGIRRCGRKLEKLFSRFEFGTMDQDRKGEEGL